jgi:hypothetical protein
MRTIFRVLLFSGLALVAVADTNVTGRWTGTFHLLTRDGQTKDSTAVLVLQQTGTEITGTVGPNEDEQHAITKGKIDGDKIALESADGGLSIKFDMTLVADRLTGDVNAVGEGGAMKARLDVTRAK